MKLYAVIQILNGVEEIVTETISTNLDFVKADMLRLQSRTKEFFYVATFDNTEKLTPPAGDWTSEVVVKI